MCSAISRIADLAKARQDLLVSEKIKNNHNEKFFLASLGCASHHPIYEERARRRRGKTRSGSRFTR
jgi:hypothetical protein